MKKIKNSLTLLAFAATAICGLSFLSFEKKSDEVDASDYYASVTDSMTGSTLQSQLHSIINNGSVSQSYDWSRFEAADEDPNNSNNIITIYARTSLPKTSHVSGSSGWNREHSFPQSKMDGGNGSKSDNHVIFASDNKVNGKRSNYKLGDHTGIAPNVYDYTGKLTPCIFSNSVFDPGDTVARGMVARATFYCAAMYNYNIEDNIESIETALRWHLTYKVGEIDKRRNEVVYSNQHNRNPFVDHPSYACRIWGTSGSAKTICDQYNGWTDGDEPTPTKTLLSIEVTGTPTKLVYEAGESFSTAGLTVTANYSDETSENVTSKVTVNPSVLTEGTTSVTLSYTYSDVTKSKTISGLTVKAVSVNYGTLENPLSVSEAKALIGKQCTSSGTYTKQPIYCKGKVGSILNDDDLNYRHMVNVRDLNNVSSVVKLESLNMSKEQYNVFAENDTIIFHGYGYKSSEGTDQFKFKDKYEITLDINEGKEIPIESVTITNTETQFYSGNTGWLSTVYSPENATYNTLTYTTDNPDVADITSNGYLSFGEPGTATVTVTAESGASDSITFTVVEQPVSVSRISAYLPTNKYYVGDNASIKYEVYPANATDKRVTFSSSDDGIAMVDESGHVEFLKPGTVGFTVTSVSDPTVECTFEVNVLGIDVAAVYLDDCETNVKVGSTVELSTSIVPDNATIKTLTYSSDNPSVATVNANGKVSFIGAGTVTITAKAHNDISDSITFTVTGKVVPVEDVRASLTKDTYRVGETAFIQYEVLPENATNKGVTFESCYPDIASVDDNGKVTFLKAGKAKFYVNSVEEERIYDAVEVNVVEPEQIIPVEDVRASFEKDTYQVGETAVIQYEVLPDNATNKAVTFETCYPNIATVDESGTVTFLKAGKAKFYVNSVEEERIYAAVEINVIDKPQGEIVEIAVANYPTKAIYNLGEKFDSTGLVVIANYLDGSISDITSEVVISNPSTGSTGSKLVNISYQNKFTTSFAIYVINEQVNSLTIKNKPLKTHYYSDESFNPLGLKIEADIGGNIEDVTNLVSTSYDFTKSDEVVFGFRNKTVVLNVVIEQGTISEEHKAADFAYVVENSLGDVAAEDVTLAQWKILQHYYNQLEAAVKELLQKIITNYANGTVSAAEELSETLKECAIRYDEIYLAHKDQPGFTDFMSRSPKPYVAPTPGPTPDADKNNDLLLLIGIIAGSVFVLVIVVVICVAASKKGKKKHA